jgi:glyoxylase-like metal-dependent hydrolase (beta-lactamase superfamily II)
LLTVTRVLAPNPSVYTLEGTNTWIVGDGPVLVIDPGPDDAGHLDEVGLATAARGPVAAVVVTHDHPDHAPGAGAFAAAAGAPLYAFRLQGADRLRDGQVLRAGELEIVVLHTPGHTSDHVCLHVPSAAALFTGDAVLGRGTSFIDPPDGDLSQYLRSLQRMADLAPRTIYPGHGPVVLRAREKLRSYLEHRAAREEQVLQALADGLRTIPDMVASIYTGYPPEVHELAGRSVLAHLLKLESEGRADKSGRGKSVSWSAASPRTCDRCGKPVKGRGRYCPTCSFVMLQEGAGGASTPD